MAKKKSKEEKKESSNYTAMLDAKDAKRMEQIEQQTQNLQAAFRANREAGMFLLEAYKKDPQHGIVNYNPKTSTVTFTKMSRQQMPRPTVPNVPQGEPEKKKDENNPDNGR